MVSLKDSYKCGKWLRMPIVLNTGKAVTLTAWLPVTGDNKGCQGSQGMMFTVKPLIYASPNPKTEMFLVLSCSCLCKIYWNQVLSQKWRCSWSSADRRCSNYIWVINNFIAYYGVAYSRGLMTVTFSWTRAFTAPASEMLEESLRASLAAANLDTQSEIEGHHKCQIYTIRN